MNVDDTIRSYCIYLRETNKICCYCNKVSDDCIYELPCNHVIHLKCCRELLQDDNKLYCTICDMEFKDEKYCKKCRKRGHNWTDCLKDISSKYVSIYDGYNNPYDGLYEVEEDESSLKMTSIGYIKLYKLDFMAWDKGRYKRSYSLVKERNNVRPIDVDFDMGKNTFILLDGNHRAQVCYDLGYTDIPAIIRSYRYYDDDCK